MALKIIFSNLTELNKNDCLIYCRWMRISGCPSQIAKVIPLSSFIRNKKRKVIKALLGKIRVQFCCLTACVVVFDAESFSVRFEGNIYSNTEHSFDSSQVSNVAECIIYFKVHVYI